MDLLWLGVVMKDFYSHELGALARREGLGLAPRWSGHLVYLLIPAGIVIFVRPILGETATLCKRSVGGPYSDWFSTASTT